MANLSKWTPFKFDRRSGKSSRRDQPVARAQVTGPRELDQLMRAFFMDDWFTPAVRTVTQTPSWFGDFTPAKFTPSVDVFTDNNNLIVSAELPGMEADNVKLTVNEGVLTLTGEKRHEFESDEEGCFRTERFFGSFKRTIPLPIDVKADAAEARFDNGVLTVKFPRTPEEKPAEVEIPLS